MKLLLLAVTVLLLGACTGEPAIPVLEDPVPDQQMNSAEKNLSLSLEEDRFDQPPSSLKITLQNDSRKDYDLGEFYHIEVKVDEKWHSLKYSDAVFFRNPQFTDFGHSLKSGTFMHQTFSIEELGVPLSAGEYRLVKTFLAHDEPFHEITIAAPFTVVSGKSR